jgi:regulator of sigma E protease
VLIVVHEFGHFAAAKMFGVRVDVFSVGFGRRLWGFCKGGTDYRLSAIPLGGYVKMAGENPLEPRSGAPDEFMSHPRWQRLVIAFAGPAMNIVLAIALLTGVYMVRYEHLYFLDQPAVIGWVLPDSPAAKAGLKPGDRLVRIEDEQNPTWEDVLLKEVISPGQPLHLAVERDSQILRLQVTPKSQGADRHGTAGWIPEQPFVVTEVEAGLPAAKAGIQVGDRVVAAGDQPVHLPEQLLNYLQESKDKPVTLTVMRNGQRKQITLTPVLTQDRSGSEQHYRIGVASVPMRVDKLPFAAAFSKSLEQNKKFSLLVVEMVQKMVERKVSLKQMSGPIGIAQASGQAAMEKGWTPLLSLMALVSINLGIFNLFPIPILDGGVILLLLIESLMRRDINQQLKERIYQAAFVSLVLFAAVVIYNDITKALPGMVQFLQ